MMGLGRDAIPRSAASGPRGGGEARDAARPAGQPALCGIGGVLAGAGLDALVPLRDGLSAIQAAEVFPRGPAATDDGG